LDKNPLKVQGLSIIIVVETKEEGVSFSGISSSLLK
jgi:hypothetical protein